MLNINWIVSSLICYYLPPQCLFKVFFTGLPSLHCLRLNNNCYIYFQNPIFYSFWSTIKRNIHVRSSLNFWHWICNLSRVLIRSLNLKTFFWLTLIYAMVVSLLTGTQIYSENSVSDDCLSLLRYSNQIIQSEFCIFHMDYILYILILDHQCANISNHFL